MDLVVEGETLTLLAERAVRWRETVLVADVHLGKSAAFRGAGLPVPPGELDADLDRLAAVCRDARRLVVLGDLVHGAVDADTEARVAAWRGRVPEVVLVAGNHDRRGVPASWRLLVVPAIEEGPFSLAHHPAERRGFVLCGHLHPVAVLAGRRDRVRLPAFWLRERMLVLPAFGSFTGGIRVRPAARERLICVTGTTLLEPGAPSGGGATPPSTS
jgi:DNA ligase-associated metallophosphoesterase